MVREQGENMAWFEGDIIVDGGRLHYSRRGRGPAVVLAHGFSDNGRCWERVAKALEDSFDLVAYDARFHGLSDAVLTDSADGASDLLAVVDALGLDRPALIGHSMGAGAVATALAARPDGFRAAVLEDPGWHDTQRARGPATPGLRNLTGWMQRMHGMTLDEIIERGKAQWPTWHDDEFPAWAESKRQLHPPDDFRTALGSRGVRRRWQDLVTSFACPVLLVCGSTARGAIVSGEVAAEARALSSHVEVEFFDAGHNIRREAFDEVVGSIRAFLFRTT
jgi:N-formylmaleamate deformylase